MTFLIIKSLQDLPSPRLPARDLARDDEFSKIAVINIFFTVLKKQLSAGGSCVENFEISHAIDM